MYISKYLNIENAHQFLYLQIILRFFIPGQFKRCGCKKRFRRGNAKSVYQFIQICSTILWSEGQYLWIINSPLAYIKKPRILILILNDIFSLWQIPDEFSFSMFYSQPPYADLIFQDATQQLKELPREKQHYRA